MSYRIVYGQMPRCTGKKRIWGLRFRIWTAVFFLMFVLVVRLYWPEGRGLLRTFLLPGEPSVTEAAYWSLVANLRQGFPAGEALSAFCQQIIDAEVR